MGTSGQSSGRLVPSCAVNSTWNLYARSRLLRLENYTSRRDICHWFFLPCNLGQGADDSLACYIKDLILWFVSFS